MRPDMPGPLRRRGPRPLMLHLTLAMLSSNASGCASRSWSGDWETWKTRLGGLTPGRAFAVPAGLPNAAELLPQADPALIAGIAAYRRHPWQRRMPDPPIAWTEEDSRLLDFGPADGLPLVIIPSLINRAYVLDLMPDASMLRWLAAHGIRPLLLDWGWPGEVERGFNLTDYVTGRLERALVAARRLAGERAPVVAGYCMGGLLAVAAVLRRPELASRLALLATPWDFQAGDPATAAQFALSVPLLEPLMSQAGTLPVDALQTLFSLLDPAGIGRKFRAFGQRPQHDAAATGFVALEDWLADGVPLAAPVARECLAGWYGRNTPAAGAWRIAGLPVLPAELRLPSLVVVPDRDRIVPPESALPLAELIPGAVLHRPRAGHVGMVAGAQAEAALWQPMLDWLRAGERTI
jgi:poly(3-hydroxyalkanoate) synthetase